MKNDKMKQQYRINEQIRVREVRIVGDDGSTVVPIRQALDMARDQEVDLVEISPNANPPVCRLIDYSKFLYLTPKKAGVAKKSQQARDREASVAEAKEAAKQQAPEVKAEIPANGGLFANAKISADALKKLTEGEDE